MKLLFGLAVAILVLATTLEVVNAGNGKDVCGPGTEYALTKDGKECIKIRVEPMKSFTAAKAECETEGGRLMDNLDHREDVPARKLFWYDVNPTPPCHRVFSSSSPDEFRTDDNDRINDEKCYLTSGYVCLRARKCNCTVKDDPMIIGGDGAITQLIGGGRYHLLEYENQTNVCEFDVKIRTSESDPFKFLVDEIEIDIFNGTSIYIDPDQYQILPGLNITYNASAVGVVFRQDAVVDADGNVTTPGYQLRQTEYESIVFEVDDCYQSLEAFPRGDHFDLNVIVEAVGHSAISGLCGNFDDDPSNDLTTADGRNVSDQPDRYIQMSDSYRIQSP